MRVAKIEGPRSDLPLLSPLETSFNAYTFENNGYSKTGKIGRFSEPL